MNHARTGLIDMLASSLPEMAPLIILRQSAISS